MVPGRSARPPSGERDELGLGAGTVIDRHRRGEGAGRGEVTGRLHDPEDVARQFDLVPLKAKPKALKHVLSNSFGFGGVNASLVFSAV